MANNFERNSEPQHSIDSHVLELIPIVINTTDEAVNRLRDAFQSQIEQHDRRIAELSATLEEQKEIINDLINTHKQAYYTFLEIKHKDELKRQDEMDRRNDCFQAEIDRFVEKWMEQSMEMRERQVEEWRLEQEDEIEQQQ